MAFNLIAECENDINWNEIYISLSKNNNGAVELFPIDFQTANTGKITAIGISIPLKGANSETFLQVNAIVEKLISHRFRVYELYNGEEITLNNLGSIPGFFN